MRTVRWRKNSRSVAPSVLRPAFWSDLKDRALRAEEEVFSLGADLLVVPRWSASAHLPHGDWREFSLVEGDLADVNQPTLKIRAGSIVPVGKIVQSTAETSLDPLTLLVALDNDGKAEGTLYEDAGDGFAYQQEDYCLTTFQAERRDGKIALRRAVVKGGRPTRARSISVQYIGADGKITAPERAELF